MTTKIIKKQKLRNNEYYDTQNIFDDLYNKSKNGYKFKKLMEIITSDENIELAYRNIKRNTGSNTCGTNGHTMKDIELTDNVRMIDYIRNRLRDYKPHPVRRVEIPKANGKTRPLGIPTIEDRIIQQCIKQVLEPICEAKFYNHSYGFRPNRSTHHAISRCYTLANINKLHYVVDIDIKGFFDNVDHSKLLKQMWTLGIQDKNLICVISKMLKAPIKGIGIPSKGTPQGGILSPLLSNIVLNELDWWVANQWETFKTEHNYDVVSKNGVINQGNKYRALRKTKMKEMYIVRYADDFKIFCKNYNTAKRIFHATKQWLKDRLHLEISEEKSKIVNLKTNYSEYLGIKMKLHLKNGKYVIQSHMSDKAMTNVTNKIKQKIKDIQSNTEPKTINSLNSTILGIQNYYKIATNITLDVHKIAYQTDKMLYNRTKKHQSKNGTKSQCYCKYYGKYKYKTVYIEGIAIYPLNGVKTKPPMNFSQDICNYTKEGRIKIHKNQNSVSTKTLRYIMENPNPNRSIEYNDNRISLYVGQNGTCPISHEYLEIGEMECHHKIPTSMGGTDSYENLIYVTTDVHKLIHANDTDTINKYKERLNLNKRDINKLNKLRKLVGNFEI